MEVTERIKFYRACEIIIENEHATALNYCINYAKAGLQMTDPHTIDVQIPYILSNMEYWRGSEASEVRDMLKNINCY